MKAIEFLKITKEFNIEPDNYALMTAGDLLKGTAGAETELTLEDGDGVVLTCTSRIRMAMGEKTKCTVVGITDQSDQSEILLGRLAYLGHVADAVIAVRDADEKHMYNLACFILD